MAGEKDLELSSPDCLRHQTACNNTFQPAFDTAADALCSRSQDVSLEGIGGGSHEFQAASYLHRHQVSGLRCAPDQTLGHDHLLPRRQVSMQEPNQTRHQQQGQIRQTLAEVLRVSGGAAVPPSIAELLTEDQPRLPAMACHASSHTFSERSERDLGQPIFLSRGTGRMLDGSAQVSPVPHFFRHWLSLSTQ